MGLADVADPVLANTNLSTHGLGTITAPGLHGVAPRGVRALDSGAIQVIGHDVNVPTNAIWNGDYSRWFFLTTNKGLNWISAQSFASNTYGANLTTLGTIQRYPMSGSALTQSYGLASLDVLYGNQQVLFTAEPDGRLFSWSATNTTAPLQRQLFSSHDLGKSWHALAGVRTLAPAQGLLGLRVDPAVPNRCDVVLWPPQREFFVAAEYPQTAPVTQILAAPNAARTSPRWTFACGTRKPIRPG